VKRHITMQIRKQCWAFAGLFLLAFCWLGFAAVSFGALFKDLGVKLPTANKFAADYGPIAFPLFGIVGATAFILSDVLVRSRWVQWVLVAVFTLLLIWAISSMLPGIVDETMAPTYKL
jgi:hypothetical protein